jgi:hypothetical protein
MNNSLLFNNFTKQKKREPQINTVNIVNETPKIKDFIIDDIVKKNLYFNDKLNEHNLHSINIPYTSDSKFIHEKKERINRILIDSLFRNRVPKNILDTKYLNIPENSISLYSTNNEINLENIMRIHNQNTFNINDKIIIQNLKSIKVQLKNPISMINNDPYIKIYHPNHKLKNEYIIYNDIYINISNVVGNSADKKFLNNIPITEINKMHKLYLTINKSDIVDVDYYYIKLSIIPLANFSDTNNIITIEILNLYGVPLNYINSGYPLNNNQLIGYHTIINVTPNYIDIQLNTNIPLSINNIGSKFIIYKVLNTIDSYPNNNQYSITFKKTLYNVNSIKLINAYFPISSYLIKTDYNDKLYWQISSDSDQIYSIQIYQNNYEPITLSKIIQENINNVIRTGIQKIYHNDNLNQKIYYNNKHISEILINKDSNLTQIKMFEEVLIFNPIKKITIDEFGYKILTINYYKHNLYIDDYIIISDVPALEGIPINIINNKHNIIKIIDINNFEIKLPIHNPDLSSSFNGLYTIKKPILFRILFNYSDTLGNVLGFRKTGNPKSITPFKKVIRNDEVYQEDFLYNEIGESILDNSNSIIPNHNIIHSNKYHYILLCSNIIESKYDGNPTISGINNNIQNIIAKIDFDNDIGKYVYNTYTNFIDKLSINITQLTTMDFTIYYPDGTLYDSNTMDHSFVLEITEDLTELINSKSNTRQGI